MKYVSQGLTIVRITKAFHGLGYIIFNDSEKGRKKNIHVMVLDSSNAIGSFAN